MSDSVTLDLTDKMKILKNTIKEGIVLQFPEPRKGKIYLDEIKCRSADCVLKSENDFLIMSFEFAGEGRDFLKENPQINLVCGNSLEGSAWICKYENVMTQGNLSENVNVINIPLHKNYLANSSDIDRTRFSIHIEFGNAAKILTDSSYFSFFD